MLSSIRKSIRRGSFTFNNDKSKKDSKDKGKNTRSASVDKENVSLQTNTLNSKQKASNAVPKWASPPPAKKSNTAVIESQSNLSDFQTPYVNSERVSILGTEKVPVSVMPTENKNIDVPLTTVKVGVSPRSLKFLDNEVLPEISYDVSVSNSETIDTNKLHVQEETKIDASQEVDNKGISTILNRLVVETTMESKIKQLANFKVDEQTISIISWIGLLFFSVYFGIKLFNTAIQLLFHSTASTPMNTAAVVETIVEDTFAVAVATPTQVESFAIAPQFQQIKEFQTILKGKISKLHNLFNHVHLKEIIVNFFKKIGKKIFNKQF